jgi:RNA polymerase sigma-70 factor (ECF subfamily)
MLGSARQRLENRIDVLPSECRIVFVLRAIERMSVAEIATCLRISRSMVRRHLLRAERRLRKSLGADTENALTEAFPCDGSRCERIVSTVLQRLGGRPAER